MRDLWEYAWRETVRRKGRTLANVVGYLLAVAIMVVLISVLMFSQGAAGSVLTGVGTHFIAYIPYTTAADLPEFCCALPPDTQRQNFLANGAPSIPMATYVVEQIKRLPTVADASPCLSFKFDDPQVGSFTVVGFDPANTLAVGTTCCSPKNIVQGRFLQPDDTGLVLLEESFAVTRLLSVGSQITIADTNFKVAGIINPGIRPAKGDVYMTLNEAGQVINEQLKIQLFSVMNIVLVESAGAKVHQQAMEDVSAALGPMNLMSTYWCSWPAAKVMGIDEKGIWLITIIVGLSVVALALKSQYSSVIERRHDIGIMKVIGWTNSNIVSQILAEAVLQAAIGGVLGCLIAVIVLLLIPPEVLTGIETTAGITIYPAVLGASFGLALLGGIVAGIFPALAAARLRPADSLRRI